MIRGNLADRVLCNSAPATDYPWNSRRSLLRSFGAVGTCLLGFLGACCVLRLFLPDPITLYAEIRSEKLALAEHWAGMVSVAAFGSSHVDCGFDPRSFDQVVEPGARHAISLNLAVAGGSQIEQTAVAREYQRRVAATAVRKPQLLLMEANSGVNFTPKFMTHPRSINIYDGPALRLALQFSDPKLGRRRAVGRSLVAIADYGLHFINVGMLSSRIFRPPLNTELVATQTVNDRRGLSPPPPSPGDITDSAAIRALMAALPAKPSATPAVITPGLCSEVDELQRGDGSTRYTVAYFVTPKLTDLRSYDTYPTTLACGAQTVVIIDVALPEVHPELYDPALWHDINHLNEHGAGVYSHLLGLAVKRSADAAIRASL